PPPGDGDGGGGAISGGGGALAATGELKIADSVFLHNRADAGGSLFFAGPVATISRSEFVGSSAAVAGAMFFYAPPPRTGEITIEDGSVIRDNEAEHAAGILLFGGSLHLNNTKLLNNEATKASGG